MSKGKLVIGELEGLTDKECAEAFIIMLCIFIMINLVLVVMYRL